MRLGTQHTNKLYVYRSYIILHSKDAMLSVFLCIAILASAPVVIAFDRSSSIAGPIFRTQPAPRPGPSRSNDHTAAPEIVLVPQPALYYSDDQTTVTDTDGDAKTNPPQQQLHSMQSLDDANLPQGTQPASSNGTATDTDALYCDQDDEYVEDDYIPFFWCIPIILLIILVLLGHLNLHYFYTSKIKKDSLESICSQTNNSKYNTSQD